MARQESGSKQEKQSRRGSGLVLTLLAIWLIGLTALMLVLLSRQSDQQANQEERITRLETKTARVTRKIPSPNGDSASAATTGSEAGESGVDGERLRVLQARVEALEVAVQSGSTELPDAGLSGSGGMNGQGEKGSARASAGSTSASASTASAGTGNTDPGTGSGACDCGDLHARVSDLESRLTSAPGSGAVAAAKSLTPPSSSRERKPAKAGRAKQAGKKSGTRVARRTPRTTKYARAGTRSVTRSLTKSRSADASPVNPSTYERPPVMPSIYEMTRRTAPVAYNLQDSTTGDTLAPAADIYSVGRDQWVRRSLEGSFGTP